MYDRSAFVSIIPSIQSSNYQIEDDDVSYPQEFRLSQRSLVPATRTIGTEYKQMRSSGRHGSSFVDTTAINYHRVIEGEKALVMQDGDHEMTISAAHEAMRIIARLQQQDDDNKLQDRFPFLNPDATTSSIVEVQVIFLPSTPENVCVFPCKRCVCTNIGTACMFTSSPIACPH
jgi:hypothetical protein